MANRQPPSPHPRTPRVICAGFDWVHPSPLRHLEQELARDHHVLHVESLGLRRPRPDLHDLARLRRKAARLLRRRPPAVEGPGVEVLPAAALPLPGSEVARLVNGWLLERLTRPRGGGEPGVDLVLTALPTALEFVLRVPARVKVYYRVDDWPRWPGVDLEVVAGQEQKQMDRVDLTVATSHALVRSGWSRRGPAVHLPQGVDRAHFAAALSPGPLHPAVRGLRGPVLAAFGRFDDRVDPAVLAELATAWPGTVVLAGERVGAGRHLPEGGCLRWTGPVDFDDLPSLARGVDAWILPYRLGPRTDAIDPLKLREYLATGRPVVASPLPDLADWAGVVSLAGTPGAFLEAARRAAADPGRGRDRRLAALEGQDWADRRRTFLRLVAAAGSARENPPRAR